MELLIISGASERLAKKLSPLFAKVFPSIPKKVAVEMGEELAKGIKPDGNAPKKKYEEMSNVEKAKFNRGKL